MNTSHWAWKFLGWVIAILIGAGVTVWVYKKQSHKAVVYRVVSISPLGPLQARGFADLRLSKGDRVIDRPFLITITLINAGDVSVLPSDFAAPITIRPVASPRLHDRTPNDGGDSGPFGGSIYKLPFSAMVGQMVSGQVVDARVASTSPPKIPVDLVVTPTSLQVSPLLLNVGDEITVEMLISGDVAAIEVGGRISGVKRIIEDIVVDASALEVRAALYLVAAIGSIAIGVLAIVLSITSSKSMHKTAFGVLSNLSSVAFGVLVVQTLVVAKVQSAAFVLAVSLLVLLAIAAVVGYVVLTRKVR